MRDKRQARKFETGKLFLVLFGVGFLLSIFRFDIRNMLLRNYGVCTKAKLTTETRSSRYVVPTLLYLFNVDGETFKGDSEIEDSSIVVSDICIVYLSRWPGANRPVSKFSVKPCSCAIH